MLSKILSAYYLQLWMLLQLEWNQFQILKIYNQLNDLSSIIISILPILGSKISNKSPDKLHPYGYGRAEYLISISISILAILIALSSFNSLNIISNAKTSYNSIYLSFIIFTVIVKIFLGMYYRRAGNTLKSQQLMDSGNGELLDSLFSFLILLSALSAIYYHISFDNIVTCIIVIMVFKSSWDILKDNLDRLIGRRASLELTSNIKHSISEIPDVYWVYDLVLHDYGLRRTVGTVHVEVDGNMKAPQIHQLSSEISNKIYDEYSIMLVVGIYAKNHEFEDIRKDILETATGYDGILEVKAFC